MRLRCNEATASGRGQGTLAPVGVTVAARPLAMSGSNGSSSVSSPSTAALSAISCRGLTKDYGGGHGLFDLDLEVRRGETFGFIGPNGAGKSTTIRLLMDLIRADRGSASILGLDSRTDSVAIKRVVGYLPGELMQFPRVTAGYVIGLLAGLRGGVDEDRIDELAERFSLDLGRKFETFVAGNKQKVGLIQAFMHDPDLLTPRRTDLGSRSVDAAQVPPAGQGVGGPGAAPCSCRPTCCRRWSWCATGSGWCAMAACSERGRSTSCARFVFTGSRRS